jgi:ankyrin repeat protein
MIVKKRGLILLTLVFLTVTFTGTSNSGELMNKVVYNDIEAVKKLLSTGVNINEQDAQYGSTPLMMACSYEGYTEMVKLLLDNGADPNIQDSVYGTTALIAAAGISKEVVEMLLAKGADLKIKRFDGTSAFTTCISGILSERVTTDLASLLLEKGADVDEAATSGPAEGYTCLMMAARNKAPDLVRFLVEKGADVNAKAKDGSTALSLANKEKDSEMVKLLKEMGATQ